MNILIVDDTEIVCKELKSYFESQSQQASYALSVNGALVKIRLQHFDCIVLDVDFGHDKPDGEKFVQQMNEIFLRIPVVVHTGNPESAERFKEKTFGIYKRGCDLQDVLNRLLEIEKTGVSGLLGKDGYFENIIQNFYKAVFIENKDTWLQRSSSNKENVLSSLKRMLSYRMECESHEGFAYFEEHYLNNDDSILFKGSILKKKCGESYFVVMNPSCDLVLRNGKPKVKSILLCEIEKIEKHGLSKNGSIDIDESEMQSMVSPLFHNANDNKELIKYHWIPPVKEFMGGVMNFSKVSSCLYRKIFEEYNLIGIRISLPYIKNITSRFSSYLARQGQPDLDVDPFLQGLKWDSVNKKANP